MEKYLHTTGAVPSQGIRMLGTEGILRDIDNKDIGPSSIDLMPDGDACYEIPFLHPFRRGEQVFHFVKKYGKKNTSNVLEVGKIYLVKFLTSLKDCPFFVKANAKSTIGRNFLFARMVGNEQGKMNRLPIGYSGDIWSIVRPLTYPVAVDQWMPISQLRFFNGNGRLTGDALRVLQQEKPLIHVPENRLNVYNEHCVQVHEGTIGSIDLSIDLSTDIIGYVTKVKQNNPLPLWKFKATPGSEYFETITRDHIQSSEGFIPKQGRGYILSSKEFVCIHPNYAAEIASFNDELGEMSNHRAGFVDNNYGCLNPQLIEELAQKGIQHLGNNITFELMAYESNLKLRHGQVIAVMVLEHMIETPDVLYGSSTSSYTVQNGPKLAKQFI